LFAATVPATEQRQTKATATATAANATAMSNEQVTATAAATTTYHQRNNHSNSNCNKHFNNNGIGSNQQPRLPQPPRNARDCQEHQHPSTHTCARSHLGPAWHLCQNGIQVFAHSTVPAGCLGLRSTLHPALQK
jgi:hypothetical protein